MSEVLRSAWVTPLGLVANENRLDTSDGGKIVEHPGSDQCAVACVLGTAGVDPSGDAIQHFRVRPVSDDDLAAET